MMKKNHWIVGLSLVGILSLSGTAAALMSGHSASQSSLQTLSFTPSPAVQIPFSADSSSTGSSTGVTPLVSTPSDISTSTPTLPTNPAGPGSGQYPGGYGMIGGYGPSTGGNTPSTGGNGSFGYGMMGGYGPSTGGNTPSTGGNGSFGYGMMGGWFNGTNYSTASTDQAGAANDVKTSLDNATVDKSTNTITYTGSDVNIVMLGGPANADGKFVVGNLINPTLNIPQGAKVTLQLINEDTGMPHGVEITAAAPPYPYMSMMQGSIYPGSFIPPIPAANADQYPTAAISFTAGTSGDFYYICEYPGHAEKGMYGKIHIG